MDYAEMKRNKEARYEEYCNTYAEQLRFQGYINSLERDNESLYDAKPTTGRGRRQVKKLIKINDRDIKKYNKVLQALPPVPPFK